MKKACGLDTAFLFTMDFILKNQGVLTEQFVGQELLSLLEKKESGNLFFWNREERQSSAEVDFVIALRGEIIPIEVKSGVTGRLKSLKMFMEQKQVKLGVRVSAAPLNLQDGVLSIPFYLIEELPNLIASVNL